MEHKTRPNIYEQAQRLADVTKTLIAIGNIPRAKRCMQVAENMFIKGNKEIQNAIANVYVFSLSTFMEIHRCNIKDFFPQHLKNEYRRQVNTMGV